MQTTAEITLKIELLKSGLSRRDLATRTGFCKRTIDNLLAGTNRSAVGRGKVEAVVGQVWTGDDAWRRRQRLRAILGQDPMTLTLPQIREKARALRVHGHWMVKRREDLLSLIELSVARVRNEEPDTPAKGAV